MTPDEFDAGVAVLLSVWPKEASAAETLEVYQEVVKHLPGDVWRAASLKCAATCIFFPKPAELLAAAQSLTATPQRTSLEAWGDVQQAIKDHGYYHPPDGAQVLAVGGEAWSFADPLVGQAVKSLGWRYLCMSEDEMADRAHFQKAYDQLRDRAYAEARLTPDLLAFQEQHRAALPAPAERRAQAAQIMATIGKGRG